nr:hypothetical protein [Actinomycetota bacterium]
QHRRRRPGRDVARPDPGLEPVERAARSMPGTEAAEWVDLALRYGWCALADAELDPLPAIVCVRAGTLGVELLVEPPCPGAPGRFVADDDGHTWRLDPQMDLEELRALAQGQSPLLPALVSAGVTAEGPVLIDLEQAGILAVEGDPERVEAFLAGAALELATAPWAGDTQVWLVGADPRLAAMDTVELVEDLDTLATSIEELTNEREQTLGPRASTLAARVMPANTEAWAPAVVVMAPGAASGEEAANLASHARPGRSGLAVIAPGPVPGAAWRLVIEADGRAMLDPLGLSLEVEVDAEAVAGLTALVANAADAQDVAPVVELVPEEAEPPASRESPDAEVRVLGPVVVTWPGLEGKRQPHRRKLEEVVAYLGTHDERPVPAERLRVALWPLRDDPWAGEVANSTFRSTMSRARAALGRDATGQLHLPEQKNGTYELGPRFGCDWSRFKALARDARTASSDEAIELLREALALVRGAPFADVLPGTYAWAWSEQLVSEIEVAVADAAEELAERAREAGDAELARWATRQGLLVIPSREVLYRQRMLAAFDAGDQDDIEQAYVEARRAARAVDDLAEPQDETSELYERLRQACRPMAGGSSSGSPKRAREA